MSTIDDLNRSISDMEDPELFSFIREMRNTRRIFKQRKQKKKSKAKPKKKAVNDVLSKMTKEEAIALLKKLKGGS